MKNILLNPQKSDYSDINSNDRILLEKTIDFFDLLKEFPEMGSIEFPEKQIRGFQLTKQTRILYRIKNKNIIVLAFFDVRQNPKKKFK